ncbi:MAG TPA: FAD-dependent oxidoreductase [Candidatus Dormibacteraeota bacterium]|nr:FAD-dependent oxidoreductase [Candidatus Dormibacteraeota bacterium]
MSTPFWSPPPERYPGTLPDKADVLIVGGGIAGTSLLWHLTRLRIDAVLVERHHLAWGASGRNAGFLLAGVASSYAEAVGTYGREVAREVWEVTNENHDRMLEAARGQQVGHRRLGSAILPASDGERALLIESEQLLQEDGFEARWDGTRLVNPRDGEIDPAAMVAALARQARPRSIREGVSVTALEPRRQGVSVTAGEARCEAGVVVLATNAYSAQLVPSLKIQPTRAQMVATAPDANPIADMPIYSNFGYRYWRQLPTGEVLLGGWRDTSLETEKTDDDRPTPEIQEHLDRALENLHVSAEVTHRWAGTMGFTESGLPIAGPLEGLPNVYACAGFTGHGMGFAFMTAKRVAEAI